MSDNNQTPRPIIFGFQGLELSPEERSLFADSNPFGFILFKRNISNPDQVRSLIESLRILVGRRNLPVFIDQEGGRVVRLKPPHWRFLPSAQYLVARSGGNVEKACRAIFLNSRILAHELSELLITVNCMPVLDLLLAGSHEVIGDRAYSAEPEHVGEYGRAACDGLLSGGVLPVIKHIPGHGRATADSHESLPFVNARLSELVKEDFVPFRTLAHMPYAMTAHIVFSNIDRERPVTISPLLVSKIIREHIGFKGLLITDDICMSALDGSIVERAQASLFAGCDLVLHCSGILSEMQDLTQEIQRMGESSWEKAQVMQEFYKRKISEFDLSNASKELAELLI